MLKMRSFTVGEVNKYVNRILTSDPLLRQIMVQGEISNLTKHGSGHYYFSLKDETGKLSCVMFANQTQLLTFKVENGDKVTVKGQITVYEKDGRYQLYAMDMEKMGIGELHIAYEKLKAELDLKGYFDPSLKKPLPQFPNKIGVITSPTGAAIRDIISVYERRSPLATLVIYPVRVQGAFSKDEIVKAITYFDQREDIDMVILSRGGGSIEELWSFNERVVAEAIFKANVPIVSGVGHEIDYTISDFVADVRAATPSAAAEIAIVSRQALLSHIESLKEGLIQQVQIKLRDQHHALKRQSPSANAKRQLLHMAKNQRELEHIQAQMTRKLQTTLTLYKERLTSAGEKLSVLSPLNTLERGYTVVRKNGHALSSAGCVTTGDNVELIFKDGRLEAQVIKVDHNTKLDDLNRESED